MIEGLYVHPRILLDEASGEGRSECRGSTLITAHGVRLEVPGAPASSSQGDRKGEASTSDRAPGEDEAPSPKQRGLFLPARVTNSDADEYNYYLHSW